MWKRDYLTYEIQFVIQTWQQYTIFRIPCGKNNGMKWVVCDTPIPPNFIKENLWCGLYPANFLRDDKQQPRTFTTLKEAKAFCEAQEG